MYIFKKQIHDEEKSVGQSICCCNTNSSPLVVPSNADMILWALLTLETSSVSHGGLMEQQHNYIVFACDKFMVIQN